MDLTLTVRPAHPGDLGALDALLARAYPRLLSRDYPPSTMVTALPLIARANPELLYCGTYYVAEDTEGALVGAGGWTRKRYRHSGEVRHVVTSDRHTRRGIGRAILEKTITTAREAGLAHLDCAATRTAVPFYRALGFTGDREYLLELRPGITFPAIEMRRTL